MDHGQEACDHICSLLGQIQSKTGITRDEQKGMNQEKSGDQCPAFRVCFQNITGREGRRGRVRGSKLRGAHGRPEFLKSS